MGCLPALAFYIEPWFYDLETLHAMAEGDLDAYSWVLELFDDRMPLRYVPARYHYLEEWVPEISALLVVEE